MDIDKIIYLRMHLINFIRNGDWTKKYKHEWYGKKMDQKSKHTIRFTDLQLHQDYSSN